MCKLTTVIKRNNKNDDLIIKTIKSQERIMGKEPHGISALIVGKDNKVQVKKEMNDYSKIFKWVYSKMKSSKVLSIHTRQATSGDIDKKNLHFFKVDEYYLAHNGIVSGYESFEKKKWKSATKDLYYKDYHQKYNKEYLIIDEDDEKGTDKQELCDSYKFLLDIKKPMDEDDILELMVEQNFNGVGVIIDSKRNKLYSLTTRELYMHTNMRDYTINYSFDPNDKIETIKEFMGFDVKNNEENIISLNREKALEGIYRYDF